MPIGAKMYEQEQAEAAKSDDESEDAPKDSKSKKSSKKGDEPIEGEVVDDQKDK
jgi:hypothetical protein